MRTRPCTALPTIGLVDQVADEGSTLIETTIGLRKYNHDSIKTCDV